jgi:hypothetical protein
MAVGRGEEVKASVLHGAKDLKVVSGEDYFINEERSSNIRIGIPYLD